MSKPVPVFSAPALQPTEDSRLESFGPRAPYRGPQAGNRALSKAGAGSLPTALLSGRMGQLPTLPPPPEPPFVIAPIPPPTFQSPAPGLVAVRRGTEISPEQAARFLHLAERSMVVVRAALDQAATMTSKPRDRHVAAAIFECIGTLGENMGYFAQGISELRAAVRESRVATLSSRQARSIEDFASCAQEVGRREGSGYMADAAVGSGLSGLWLAALLAL